MYLRWGMNKILWKWTFLIVVSIFNEQNFWNNETSSCKVICIICNYVKCCLKAKEVEK